MGNTGWSYADVLPYFRKSEANQRLNNEAHSKDGLLSVQDQRLVDPGADALMQAAAKNGTPIVDDINNGKQHGITKTQLTTRGKYRASTATEFLRPAMARQNLDVECNALVSHVDLEGKKAAGVTFVQNGARRSVTARREVILSGGVINSPQLLMLSGIGPGAHLRDHGITVRQ